MLMETRFNTKKWIITFSILLFLVIAICILSFRPIISPKEDDCSKIAGILSKYRYLDKSNDLQIKLKNDTKVYYINNIQKACVDSLMMDTLKGKMIIIYAVNHWTLLDPKSKFKHVARLTTINNKILYTEY